MSTSHLTMAQSSLTFTPNLQTKTNTYYIRHVIPYTPERAISFSLALRLRHICSTNETFTLRTNEIIYYLNKCVYNLYFLQREIQQLTISHGQKHLRPMTLVHWTNKKVFPLLSPTTQPFVSSLGFHLYYAMSVKVQFYKSSITFRLLNRDTFSSTCIFRSGKSSISSSRVIIRSHNVKGT